MVDGDGITEKKEEKPPTTTDYSSLLDYSRSVGSTFFLFIDSVVSLFEDKNMFTD